MIQAHSKTVFRFGNITFSEIEVKDLVKAWAAISLAFAIVIGSSGGIVISFFVSALTVGIGFILHELGHKIVAQRYGAWAEFRAWNQMLILAIVFSFFGFIFAAPGAVMIFGRTIGKSRYGKIAAAGPIMNFVLAGLFLAVMINIPINFVQIIGRFGFIVNTWLGLFNMIPFAMLDGKKIWDWDKKVFFILVSIGVGLMFVGNFI